MDTVKNCVCNVKNRVLLVKDAYSMSYANLITKNVLQWLKGIIFLEYNKGAVTQLSCKP